MGSNQTKEELVVAQTASGGSNGSGVEQLKVHASTTNIILLLILTLLFLGLLYLMYRIYKNCHVKWMTNEINRHALRRSIAYFRRDPRLEAKAEEV